MLISLRRNSLSPVYWLEIVPRSDFQIVYTVLLITTTVGGYKKASHTRHRALGPELIPVYRQLFSARPAVASPAAEHHRPLAGIKLYCLVTEAHRCKQLAQGCYAALPRAGFEPATYWSQVQRLTVAPPRHLGGYSLWNLKLQIGLFFPSHWTVK